MSVVLSSIVQCSADPALGHGSSESSRKYLNLEMVGAHGAYLKSKCLKVWFRPLAIYLEEANVAGSDMNEKWI